MKKVLFALPLLCAAVLIGCGPKEQPSKITSVTVKPAQATIAEGADITLTAIATPATERGEYTWTSSDTLIATVDQEGNVHGVSAGTAYITATEKGGLSAQSEIHVASYLEAFSFGQAMVYNFSSKDTTGREIELVKNGQYKAYKVPIEFMVYSEGFYVNEEGYYDGAEEALVISMPSYMYWAPKELNNGKGTILCLGQWGIVAGESENETHVGEPGVYGPSVLSNLLKAFEAYNNKDQSSFSAYLRAAGEGVTGTSMSVWQYGCSSSDPTNCGYSSSIIADAILEEALFDLSSGTPGSSSYMVNLDYCGFRFRQLVSSSFWGVDATYDEENDKLIVNDASKLQISDPILMEFGKRPTSVGSKNFEENWVEFPESILPSEEVQANIKRQMEEGKIRSININSLMRK